MNAAQTFANATRGILHWLNNLDLRSGFICLGLLGFIVFFADKSYGAAIQYLPLIVMSLIVDLNRVRGISRAVGSVVLVVCLDRRDAGGWLSLVRMVVLAELARIVALVVFLLAAAIALRLVLMLERVECRPQ